jgi:hypothetical protein
MGKLIIAKIDVKKIVKALLYEGKKGTYLNLNIWINDKPDNYGNDISIQQQTKKGEPVIYIGEGKFYVKKEAEPLPDKQGEFQGKKEPITKEDILNAPADPMSDLPF